MLSRINCPWVIEVITSPWLTCSAIRLISPLRIMDMLSVRLPNLHAHAQTVLIVIIVGYLCSIAGQRPPSRSTTLFRCRLPLFLPSGILKNKFCGIIYYYLLFMLKLLDLNRTFIPRNLAKGWTNCRNVYDLNFNRELINNFPLWFYKLSNSPRIFETLIEHSEGMGLPVFKVWVN